MKFYRINDYPGEIPNPKSFPVRYVTIVAVKGYPWMFSDKYMLDMTVKKKDQDRLQRYTAQTIDYDTTISNLIANAKKCQLLLSEPKYILRGDTISYGMTHSGDKVKFIQTQYYHYFRNRYSICQFFTNEDDLLPIAVKRLGILVGVVMSVMFRRTVAEVEKEL